MAKYHKAILFYNEKSGQSDYATQINLIRSHFAAHQIDLTIINVPLPPEEIAAIVKKGQEDGIDLVMAAGGDGTVAMVATPLIHTDLPLGILPTGTGNLLAKELKLPQRLEKSLEIITADTSEIFVIDTIQLDHQNFVLNLSVGVSSKVMGEINSEEKQRLGFSAYLLHFIEQLLGLTLDRYTIEYDDHRVSHAASEVLITNSRLLGVEPLKWPGDVALDDGQLDLFIIRAANFPDLLRFLATLFSKNRKKNPIIKSYRFEKYCRIETKDPIRVQADGDAVGETPIEIKVQPHSLNIIVPSVKLIASSKNTSLRERNENEKFPIHYHRRRHDRFRRSYGHSQK